MAWLLAAALAAGITGDFRIAVIAFLLFVRLARRGEITLGTGLVLALVAVLFFAYGWGSIAGFRRDIAAVFTESLRSDDPVVLEGWVCRFPYYRYGGVAFELKTRVAGTEQTVFVQSREFLVGYGDSLRVRGVWKTPEGVTCERWTARLLAMGVSGEFRAFAGEVERIAGTAGGWMSRRVFYPCHDAVRRALCRGLGSRSGIPVALVIGERGYLDRRANEAFRTLGISHLLALSGLHLGFVAASLVVLLRLLRRRGQPALLAALALYVAVVGPIISLYRAFVMAVVLIIASLVRRPLAPLTALVQAFIVILLLYPSSFYAVGFQLSFMATFAVLLCVRGLRPPPSRRIPTRIVFWIRSSLRVSIAAQVFVAPVIIHYFDRVSLLAPLATLVFVIPVAIVLFSSALASILWMVSPVAGTLACAGLDRVVTLFQSALIWSARALPATVDPSAPNPWLYYGGLCLFTLSRGRLSLRLVGIIVLVVSFFVDVGRRELS
jgi:competence protein ComEC